MSDTAYTWFDRVKLEHSTGGEGKLFKEEEYFKYIVFV